MSQPSFEALGVHAPSSSPTDLRGLRRDLEAGHRVLLRRVQPCLSIRAMPDLGERIIRFVIATEGVKRDGNSVACNPEAWRLDSYRKNPAILHAHDYGSHDRPPGLQIGSCEDIFFEKDGEHWLMIADGRFATHQLAEDTYKLYLPREQGGDGCGRAVSIGWDPLDWVPLENGGMHFPLNELLEWSTVPIGADPDAVQVMESRGVPADRAADILNVSRYMETARGRAYVLDWRDTDATKTTAPAAGARGTTSPEPAPPPPANAPARANTPEAPKVRLLTGASDAFELTPKGRIGLVLQVPASDAAPTSEVAVQTARFAVDAIAKREKPTLPDGWRAVPIVAGRKMQLVRAAGETAAEKAQIREELATAIAAGEVPILGGGWTLRAFGASDTRGVLAEQMDLPFALMEGIISAFSEPMRHLWWAIQDIFFEEETGQKVPFAITPQQSGQRALNLIAALASELLDSAEQLEGLFRPAAVADPGPQTSADHPAPQARVGKKMAKARLSKLRKALDCHEEGVATTREVIEECEAEEQESETAGAEPSELARLAADLDSAVRQSAPAASDPPPPAPAILAEGFDDLIGSLRGRPAPTPRPEEASLGDLAGSLRAASGATPPAVP